MDACPLNSDWPLLKTYEGTCLRQIAMPLGGIGTGTVSLGGRGNLLDWEIHNHPAKGGNLAENYGLRDYGAASLFTLYAKAEGRAPVVRGLESALQPPYEGSHGVTAGFHGVPRFQYGRFAAAYPFAQVCLADPAVPLQVRLEAFNPLIPADADASGAPVAVLRYVLVNPGDVPVQASVCGSLSNLTAGAERRNTFRDEGGMRGLVFDAPDGDTLAREYGSMALVTSASDVSVKHVWPDESWRRPLLHFWDDMLADGRLDDVADAQGGACLMGSMAASVCVPACSERQVTFLLTWHFPNRYNWSPKSVSGERGESRLDPADRIGNRYTELYEDAWDVALRTFEALDNLEARSLAFVSDVCGSDLPDVVKEAALFNVSTLRTETCFRTPDGTLFGWEGCCDGSGCCSGSCTHVWNYETTTAFLFGDLARSMRDVEFMHATNPDDGGMSFRVQLPLSREHGQGKTAADGQMGCIMKAYREWRLSGDTAWLERIWPMVRSALSFCWEPGGWDADRDGVMEGCQHNTMDVEYFGPNPQMQVWYLGALRAGAGMAAAVGDEAFAATCRSLEQAGAAWTDEHLFNGEYYEQRIVPPASEEDIHPRTRLHMGATDVSEPELQLGAGCLVDQLVGQYMAHVCGLGYLLDPAHVRTTLSSIMRYNFREHLHDHFNNMRTFALNDEAAIVMASYPHGQRPASPFPYVNEVMTGFEYCAATHMLFEGQAEAGLTAIKSIRNRYDGYRRNPFNEAECGHHYARAMAAWSAVLALTAFNYDGVSGRLTLTSRPGQWFWSNGYAWGRAVVEPGDEVRPVTLVVREGTLALRELHLGDGWTYSRETSISIDAGSPLRIECRRSEGDLDG